MATKAEWQGRVGETWALNADAQDAMMRPAGDAAMAALGDLAGVHVLDLGCGAGDTSLALAGRAGAVTGVDVSAPLLARARARAESHADAPLEFILADAAEWTSAAPMGALFSRFGAMFFDDPGAAWANLRAQMAPGAPLAIAAWAERDACAWADLPIVAVGDLIAPKAAPQPMEPGPFAWAEVDLALEMLRRAGWREIAATRFVHEVPIALGDEADPVARAVTAALRVGPVARALAEAAPGVRAEARARLAEAYAPHVKDDAVMLPAAAWIVTGRA